MTKEITHTITSLKQIDDLAMIIAENILPGMCIYLEGDLGAGKTTLTKNVIENLGIKDTVTSPTFSIMETYQHDSFSIHHLDLYRIESPEEIEYTGLADYREEESIYFIEWALNGGDFIPKPSVTIRISFDGTQRIASLFVHDSTGDNIVHALQ